MEKAHALLVRYAVFTRSDMAFTYRGMDAESRHVSRASLTFCSPYNSDYSVQRLLIGTHTSNDEQNHVMILKVKVPLESSKDTREYQEGLDSTPVDKL